ncbi:hypothetical protein [Streptacidiphilus jiangxiensis]|uniref:Uncharacterized protein n=1 Tax=Streptacidiphilus jiangxiensis TaxID=235985 RepID=A0A1H7W277_STRJI|nr:hypothetical protein [Streptacidiphilus jiangxiensis]SEM15581.1 hypothetical protein SAMN05414137_119168 [Streptacidiphilus jiangxiensis]
MEPYKEPWYATALRAGLELVGWIGLPIALWDHSVLAAIGVDVLLIGVPAIFQTPGDKPGTNIAVPGWVTIVMVLAELGGGVAAAWLLFWPWLAVVVTGLAVLTCFTELPRWRRLLAPGLAQDSRRARRAS